LDGVPVTSSADLAERLVTQVTESVRWDLCMDRLEWLGVTAVVELAPGGVLAGLVRRRLPDVEVVALRSPDDLPRAQALVRSYAPTGEHVTTDWQVVTAPARGTFHPGDDRSQPIGVIRGRGGDVPVVA